MTRRGPIAVLLIAALAVALTACGRKGTLQAPPTLGPDGKKVKSSGGGPVKPDRPFILDRLLL